MKLHAKDFPTYQQMVDWVNENISTEDIIDIVYSAANGKWYLFYAK